MPRLTFARIASILILVVLLPATLCARNPEKEYRKIIERYDVADVVLRADDAAEFWQLLIATDPDYRSTAKSLAGKGDRDPKKQLAALMEASSGYFAEVPTLPQHYSLAEEIVGRSGIRSVCPLTMLTVTGDNDAAVFGYPNGYMFITGGLLDVAGNDTTALEAIFAAEAAHYALQHAYAHMLYEKKRARRSLWGKILAAIGVFTAGVVLEEITDQYFPGLEFGTMFSGMILMSDTRHRYVMQYTPQQIYAADIIAYRLMQVRGFSGRTYINALRRCGYHIDASLPSAAGYPTVDQRLGLLEYLDSHPELRQKVRNRRAKPRD